MHGRMQGWTDDGRKVITIAHPAQSSGELIRGPWATIHSPDKNSYCLHANAMQHSRTDIYKYSFFPHSIRNWNALPAPIISAAETSDDSFARFTSLVRSRAQSLHSLALVNELLLMCHQ